MLQIKRHEVIVRKQQMDELQQYLQQGYVIVATTADSVTLAEPIPQIAYKRYRFVALAELERQQQLLQQGWVGTALFWRQQWIVEFRQESC